MPEDLLHPARWWDPLQGTNVRCRLCPAACEIPDGGAGRCGARTNRGGALWSRVYGRPRALHVDPIEKKPLFHVLPGTTVLSAGTAGCNLTCSFCQNWGLTRQPSAPRPEDEFVPPARLVETAVAHGCPSIAFTYNEPTILAEYVLDTALLAREAGLKVVTVTNGYIARPALDELYAHVDAANVDLKAFDDGFYRRHCGGALAPVLQALQAMKARGTWLEVTTLVIPGLNDTPEAMAEEAAWLRDHLGPDTPLHLSAFHPDHRMQDRPPTPAATLHDLRLAALAAGLRFVYEGNTPDAAADTPCPCCGIAVLERRWFSVVRDRLPDGRCEACGAVVPGVWS
jgi:pyruvate formate lyase activating enzyme